MSDTLIINPHAQLKTTEDGDQVIAITVLAPIKGEHLRVTTVARKDNPALFGLLLLHSMIHNVSGAGGFGTDERTQLSEIGLLIPEDKVSTRTWFSCDLDNLPREFLPRSERRAPRAAALDDLIVNPTLRVFGRDGIPEPLRGRLHLENPFNPDRSWLWVDTGELSGPSIYSYSSAVADVIDRLHRGGPPPTSLDTELRQSLFEAGVMVSASSFARRREARTAQTTAAGALLRQRGFLVLPQLVPPMQVAAVRRYYRELIAEGFLPEGDNKDRPNRDYSGRDPVAYFYHQQFTGLTAEIAGEPLQPSFCYFASYRTGSVLPAHRDRPQCEYAISIQLDFSPDPETASPWSLYAEPLDGSAAQPLDLPLGGALLYFGCRVRHYRDVLNQGDYSRHWFVFYVPPTFTDSLD